MALTIKNGKDLFGRTPMTGEQFRRSLRAQLVTYGPPPMDTGMRPYTGPGPKAAPFTAPEAAGQPTNIETAPTPNIFLGAQGGPGTAGAVSNLPDPRDLWRDDTAVDDRSQLTPSLEETRRRRSTF
jgi:hypothetical protein